MLTLSFAINFMYLQYLAYILAPSSSYIFTEWRKKRWNNYILAEYYSIWPTTKKYMHFYCEISVKKLEYIKVYIAHIFSNWIIWIRALLLNKRDMEEIKILCKWKKIHKASWGYLLWRLYSTLSLHSKYKMSVLHNNTPYIK